MCMIDDIIQFSDNQQIPNTVLFDILSNKRRQYALYCLDRSQTPTALADLAEEVARLEHESPHPNQIPEKDVERIYCNLRHSHIPRIEAANLLEYSRERDTVYLTYDLSALNLSKLV